MERECFFVSYSVVQIHFFNLIKFGFCIYIEIKFDTLPVYTVFLKVFLVVTSHLSELTPTKY